MREHHLQHKRRKRFVATTASHHDRPIFPKPICDRMFDGPKQVWVGGHHLHRDCRRLRLAASPMPGHAGWSVMQSAIGVRCLPQPARRSRARRLDEPAWQPIRQCQGRELHEHAEGL
jgi:hypothetical protein